ncbi:MAG: Signal-transduction histidine kinase senX3 [Candidatus Accumulibacter phosphatis]|uniref:histidine kinase n=1 Tax=Candidatus Accumulibacter phosphatis TaxID=327160 RepID=A0A080M144_9PROT|nr:MAG: Signal-transduction histidine kinase senX3 [Candidatus Accumulibacter phosphatis]HRE87223.1 HAMP domain-containing sensor histidine kinase [Accumulibacter sp.]
MIAARSFTTRLTLALALLLVAYGALVGVLGRHVAAEHEQESLQRLSHGLARHIVEHWPEITLTDPDQADRAARAELLSMLMVVNPGIQVYVLDADGRVQAYIGEPAMVRQEQVDLQVVRDFLAGDALPLRGTDPMGSGMARIFSAAMFPPRPTDTRPPGYLYVILDGQAREQQQASAHREMMASVAHDLRTPLTALHGHLEAMAGKTPAEPGRCARLLAAALAQSDKVRRLSQQLFELAALQSTDQVLHCERFRLDELVTDAVQKFDLGDGPPPVTLHGAAPGPMELDGDLQLIERALSNLIDNAMRHAPGAAPVRVSLRQAGGKAEVLIEDAGPGLPEELLDRLEQGQSLRDPPVRRSSGGIGGLGLAIAQRVAALHGGSLQALASPHGGTRLCLALPLAAQ